MKRNKILQFYRVTPFLSSSCLTRRLTIAETGRSTVEMLGVLVIIGILSLGAFSGYSYGMDRHHANETINDIRLRTMDLFMQMTQYTDVEPNLSKTWGNKGTFYSMELVYEKDTWEYALEVSEVPLRVCEMIFDGLISSYSICVGAIHYDNAIDLEGAVCENENTMIFYLQECSGMDAEGNCIVCPDGQEWFDSVGECRLANGCPPDKPGIGPKLSCITCKPCGTLAEVLPQGGCKCPENYIILNHSCLGTIDCFQCPSNSTISEDGKKCICNDDPSIVLDGIERTSCTSSGCGFTMTCGYTPANMCPTRYPPPAQK